MSRMILPCIFYIILCLIYFLWWYKRNKEESFYRLVVTLFIPIFGFIYFIILDIFDNNSEKLQNHRTTLHGIERDVVRTGFIASDFDKEINVIPMEEALLINSGNVKRKLIVNTLIEDVDKYLVFLKKALNDEDTETSHYAAAAVMDIKRKLTLGLQDLAVRYEQNKMDMETAIPYSEALKNYLQSGLLDNRTYIKYRVIYGSVLKNILDHDTSKEQYFIDKINCDIESGDYKSAKEYCHKFYTRHKNSEAPYIMNMKLYYTLRDNKRFHETLSLFKQCDITFTNSSLNTVRYWSEVTR